MQLPDEIALLEDHCRTNQFLLANLSLARQHLEKLPDGPMRERLLTLQQQALDAASESLNLSTSNLAHLRKLDRMVAA